MTNLVRKSRFILGARGTLYILCLCQFTIFGITQANEADSASLAPKQVAIPATVEAPLPPEQESASELAFLTSQINAGEADQALEVLDHYVAALEEEFHRYHADLLEPVLLRGDAYVELEQYDAALEEFARARHIARVNNGLFDASQIPAVYRQAEVLRTVGNLAEAGRREEYAYEVARRAYDNFDVELLMPIKRLANFYMVSNNPLAARSLLNRANLIHEHHETTRTDESVDVLREIAKSHRIERFPPVYVDLSEQEQPDDSFSPGLRTNELRNHLRSINSFPAGERALQNVVAIQQDRFGQHSDEALEAMLDLADWYLMFQKSYTAHTLYEHIYITLEGDAEAPSGKGIKLFEEPSLLHFPRPPNPNPPSPSKRGELREGFVQLQFGISPAGSVRNLKTLDIEGPKNMNYRVRRSMRQAVFRPTIDDGTVIGSMDQTFRYRFSYYERLKPDQGSEESNSEQEQTEPSENDTLKASESETIDE